MWSVFAALSRIPAGPPPASSLSYLPPAYCQLYSGSRRLVFQAATASASTPTGRMESTGQGAFRTTFSVTLPIRA